MSATIVKITDFQINAGYACEDVQTENNARVLDNFLNGDNLATCKPQDTWFPDRSKGHIKKNADAFDFPRGNK